MGDKRQSPQESKSYTITTESSDSEENNNDETTNEENMSNLLISLSDVEPNYVRSDSVVDLSACATDSNASQIAFIHELDCSETSNVDCLVFEEHTADVDLNQNNQNLFTDCENSVVNQPANVFVSEATLIETPVTNVSDPQVVFAASAIYTDYENPHSETMTNKDECKTISENVTDCANMPQANTSDPICILPSIEPSSEGRHPVLNNESSENEPTLISEHTAMTIDNNNDDSQILTDENADARPTSQPIEYESFIDLSTFITTSDGIPIERIPQVVIGRYDQVLNEQVGNEENLLHRSRSPLFDDDLEIENVIVDVRDFESIRISSVSPRRSPIHASPRRSPHHVSPRRSPRHVSPHRSRSPRHVSPRRSLGHIYDQNTTQVSRMGDEPSSLLNTNDQLVPEKDSDSDDTSSADT